MYIINYTYEKSSEPPNQLFTVYVPKNMHRIFLSQILQDPGRSREVSPNKEFQEVLYQLLLVKALSGIK